MTGRIDIGIDGGGTRCRLVLACEGAAPVLAEGGPCNIATDPEGAALVLQEVIARALTQTGRETQVLRGPAAAARIVAGLAGARIQSRADRFAEAFPHLIHVVDDSVIALHGALGAGRDGTGADGTGADGTVVGLGTGSFFLRRIGGRLIHHGGWGLTLGDEASGAWAGRWILAQAVRALDGRREDLARFQPILEALEHPPSLWAAQAEPKEFAALAGQVIAQGGDLADEVLSACRAALLQGLREIGHDAARCEPLILMGGFSEAVAADLPPALAACRIAPRGSALDGALAMARSLP